MFVVLDDSSDDEPVGHSPDHNNYAGNIHDEWFTVPVLSIITHDCYERKYYVPDCVLPDEWLTGPVFVASSRRTSFASQVVTRIWPFCRPIQDDSWCLVRSAWWRFYTLRWGYMTLIFVTVIHQFLGRRYWRQRRRRYWYRCIIGVHQVSFCIATGRRPERVTRLGAGLRLVQRICPFYQCELRYNHSWLKCRSNS